MSTSALARRLGALGMFALALSMPGCGDSSTDPPEPVAVVEVTAPAASVVAGRTVQLTATARDNAGNPLAGRSITWSSDNAAVARVDVNGMVTGVAPGSTSIAAAAEGKTGLRQITVLPVPVAAVTIEPSSFSLFDRASRTVTIVARDAAGNTLAGRQATLTSSDAAVAEVSGHVVTGVWQGTATLTATVEGTPATATVTVTLAPVAAITMHPSSLSLAVGETGAVFAIARDASGAPLSRREPALTTSNPAVARLTGGLVTGVAAGTATITATLDGKTATALVTVTAAPTR